MSDMRKFSLSRKIPYWGYKVYAAKQFKKEDLIEELQKRCCYVNTIRSHSFDEKFELACLKLITLAQHKVQMVKNSQSEKYEAERENLVKDIYTALSFKDINEAQKFLYSTPYIKDDYVFNLLEYTFTSLIFTDPKVERRFRVCWELWQNAIAVGTAGYSEKIGWFLPYYITRHQNRIFLIDPIKGEVKFFKRQGKLRNQKIKSISHGIETKDDGVKEEVVVAFYEDTYLPLVSVNKYGQLTELSPTGASGINRKKSEQDKLRAKGREITENYYLTTDLDTVDGSSYNIRTHSLIALMVWGLEIMKYGCMDFNSIFTLDHISGNTLDNRVDNLQLLTRTDNEAKQKNPDGWYFDYFNYWYKQLNASKQNQEYFDFRSSCI